MSELSPLGDIRVLVLTRDSYRVYKTVIGMCGTLSLILHLFRVTCFRVGESRWVSRRDGLLPRGTSAAET